MHLKPRNISLRSTFHRCWHMSGPNPIHSSDGPCGLETQGRRGIPSESTPISLQQSSNGNARKLKSQRTIETHRVGASSEAQNREEQKPEFAFPIQPIRAKISSENRKFSLRQRLFSRNFQTVQDSRNPIGSAPTKLNLLYPMVISQAKIVNPVTK